MTFAEPRRSGPYRFFSFNYPNHTAGIQNNNQAYIIPDSGDTLSKTKFYIYSPGLAGNPGSVSFESAQKNNRFLRHRGYLIYLDPRGDDELFQNDATFMARSSKYISVMTVTKQLTYA